MVYSLWGKKPERKRSGIKNIESLNVISLFSGCGGMDLGFEGGFDILRQSMNVKIHGIGKYVKKERIG